MIQILTCLISLLALDGVWLGLVAKSFYRQELGSVMRMSEGVLAPNWVAASIVYIALIAGILCFVIPKAQGSMIAAFLWGMLFGLITYGVYDFTNLAVLQAWNWKISIIDTIWGGLLCGLVSLATVWVSQYLIHVK